MPLIPKVLVVEDDDAIRGLLMAALHREPFEVHTATNGAEALALTRSSDYAVILLDLMMPTLNGAEFLDAFLAISPQSRTVIFLMTAVDDINVGKMRPDRIHAVVRKPFDVLQLVAMVREVVLTRMPPAAETAIVAASADVPVERVH
jgi:DNA-binding response OmpR family regulator